MFRALLSAIARRVTGSAGGTSGPASGDAHAGDLPRAIALPWEGTDDEFAVASLAAQQLLIQTRDTLDPRIGLRLIMESAIAMSKVDPATVPQTLPETQTK